MPDGAILCTMNVVGLYLNISHEEGFASLPWSLETRDNKQISNDTLTELANVLLKNNIFEFDEKSFKKKMEPQWEQSSYLSTSICYSFHGRFWGKNVRKLIWWRYIDDTFFIWKNSEESLKVFIQQVNIFHSTIKFTAEYSKKQVNFLDVTIKLIDGEIKAD